MSSADIIKRSLRLGHSHARCTKFALQSQQQLPLFPCSPTAVNMANFGCLPQEILEMIFQYLPLSDQVNSGFVCTQWNEVVRRNLKHVKIDPSTPFGGRWVEENMRCIGHRSRYEYFHCEEIPYEKVWHRDENDPVDREMKKLIPKLCKLTNKIETLSIEDYHLDIKSLTELFSSQTGIKSLRMKIHSLPEWITNVYYDNILELIIRHHETIEVINLKISARSFHIDYQTYAGLSNEKFAANFKSASKECLRFPRLKSLKLNNSAKKSLLALRNDLIESLITTSQLEELGMQYLTNQEIYFIKKGKLGALKKSSMLLDYRSEYEVVKHCRNIAHLCVGHSCDTTSLVNIISIVGPQLKFFQCQLYELEALNAILEKCKNVESLTLFLTKEYNFEDEAVAIKSSIPLLGNLEKLKEVHLYLSKFDVDAEVFCKLIERCGMNLQSFTLDFEGFDIHKILNAISTNCKSLKKLRLEVLEREQESTKELKESLSSVFEGCQKLTSLYLDVKVFEEYGNERDVIQDQICLKQPHLRYLRKLRLLNIGEYPKPDLVKLIQALPYCDIGNTDKRY